MPCPCGKHKTPQACSGARVLASLTPEQRRLGGARGGKTRAMQWKREIEARLEAIEQRLREGR